MYFLARIFTIPVHFIKKLWKQNERDQKYIEMQKNFINSLMHEIKHPLMLPGNIKNFIEADKLKEDEKRILNRSEDEIKILSAKLNRISEAFQWQNGLISTIKSPATLKTVIRAALNELKGEYPNIFRKVTIEIEKQEDLDETPILIDTDSLKKAFKEILKNGLFFNKDEFKEIVIQIDRKKKNLVLDFNDNGIGIKKEHWERIFEIMFVESVSRNPKECGLGVGLTIAKAIINDHQGKIKVLKSSGKGTIIQVTIPYKE